MLTVSIAMAYKCGFMRCKKKKKETIYTEIIFLIFMFIFADVKLFAIFFLKNFRLIILELFQWNRLFCMSDLQAAATQVSFLQGSWIHSRRFRLCHLSQMRWHWLNTDSSLTFGICLQPKKKKTEARTHSQPQEDRGRVTHLQWSQSEQIWLKLQSHVFSLPLP